MSSTIRRPEADLYFGHRPWNDGSFANKAEYLRVPMEERFWRKVNKAGPIPTHRPELGACWQWTGGTTNKGYGKGWMGAHYPTRLAHRIAYVLTHGAIPGELELDHLCRNPACVNPDHLEPVTTYINCIRGESFAAKYAAQTHCLRGHPFDEKNTRWTATTGRNLHRFCRECDRDRARAYRRRKKETRNAA